MCRGKHCEPSVKVTICNTRVPLGHCQDPSAILPSSLLPTAWGNEQKMNQAYGPHGGDLDEVLAPSFSLAQPWPLRSSWEWASEVPSPVSPLLFLSNSDIQMKKQICFKESFMLKWNFSNIIQKFSRTFQCFLRCVNFNSFHLTQLIFYFLTGSHLKYHNIFYAITIVFCNNSTC